MIARMVVELSEGCASRSCHDFHTGLEQHFGLNRSEMVKAVGAIITGCVARQKNVVHGMRGKELLVDDATKKCSKGLSYDGCLAVETEPPLPSHFCPRNDAGVWQ